MNEDRLIELETKMAYQEETLRVLNQRIIEQQKQIEQLLALSRQLLDRVNHVAEDALKGTAAEEIPPHY